MLYCLNSAVSYCMQYAFFVIDSVDGVNRGSAVIVIVQDSLVHTVLTLSH